MEYREFRATSVGVSDEGVIEGLVTPFGKETTIGDPKHGGFREEVAPGAFRKTLREGDPLMVYQHDMTMPLARVSAGNLDLREGDYEGKPGLAVKANPVDTSYARDMRALAQAKVLGGFSFGFNVVKDDWYDDAGKPSNRYDGTKRVLREVQLIEVSPVTRPAYGGTVLSARDEASALLEERAGMKKKGSNKPYGNVKYADPRNGKYPIDTLKHIKAAWAYINVAKNAAKYPLNGVSLSSVKAKIKAAAKKAGVKVSARDVGYLAGYCPTHGYNPCGENRCKDAVKRSEVRVKKSSKKRVLQIQVELQRASKLLGKCDVKSLPAEAQEAMAFVTAAEEHASHIAKQEGLSAEDLARSLQEPGSSTPDDDDDFALRVREREFHERSRDLGFVEA